jgi:IclR family transcriptional regulator, KDG regulon repressor
MENGSLRYKTLSDFTRIISLFEESEGMERGVSDVAKSLQMLTSKVSRMLKTLETDGWVEKNPHTGKYRVGVRFLQVGLLYVLNHPLRHIILPHVEQTARDLGLLAGWGIFKNGKVIIVDRIRMKRGPLVHLLGSDVPLHSSSYGKLFLAYLGGNVREDMLSSLTFSILTAKTISDARTMRLALDQVRSQGYAVDDEETRVGIVGIAAPVFDGSRELIAAITVSGGASEFSTDRMAEVAYLKEKALFISRQLGYKADT